MNMYVKKILIFLIVFSCSAHIYIWGQSSTINYVNANQFPLFGQIIADSHVPYGRLPSSMKGKVREELWSLGNNSSGLFIRFRTNSTSIHLRWTSSQGTQMSHMTPVGERGLDLYALEVDGWRFVNSAQPFIGSMQTERSVIQNMNPQMREFMLYLSLYDGISSLQIGVDDGSYIGHPMVESPSRNKPIVMYGTSILQGGCANRPGMAYTNIISRRVDRVVYNLGFSGNAFLDYEIAELITKVEDPSVIILDYVPNASVEQINDRAEKFFEIIRNKHKNVPIIFLEDPYFPTMYYDQKLFKEVIRKNKVQRSFFSRLQQKGHKNIWYIKSDGLIGDDREATVDGIHFTDLGAVRYVEKLVPFILNLVE